MTKPEWKMVLRCTVRTFSISPELRQFVDPTTIKSDAFTASFQELKPVLKRALENEVDTEQLERGVMAAGIANAGKLLAMSFHLIITNVPFLGSNRMSLFLNDYVENKFPDTKYDLCTVFLKHFIEKNKTNRTINAVVTLNSWLTLGSYETLRKSILNNYEIRLIADLGSRAFKQIGGEVVKICLSVVNSKQASNNNLSILDITEIKTIEDKERELKNSEINLVSSVTLLKNPNSIITKNEITSNSFLSNYAYSPRGIVTGDSEMWLRFLWELVYFTGRWKYNQIAVNNTNYYDGLSCLIDWSTRGKGMLRPGLDNEALGKKGVSVSRQSSLSAALYQGGYYDQNTAAIIPYDENHINSIWCFCKSEYFYKDVRKLDKKIGVTPSTLLKVPFDLEHWQKVAAEKYPNGLPKPYSDDPTQWLFHGHPIQTDNPLQVALARLIGYRWPAESDTEMELADEAKTLIESVKAFDHFSDDDGIFCIPSVNAEQAGADRLRAFLQALFAAEWDNYTITDLLAKEGATSSNLEDYLRKEFFIQHCKVFQNRPFIWHIWDGRNDGFSALVNYHKLDKENLSKLIYTYLGDWIRMCEAKKRNEESGAEGLLSAALKLKEKLEAILHGEAPYDIFVRWKSLAEQPIGWEPDLNDGVRLNIRPFIEADVLRKKPNIKWGIDRGKNPANSHWGEIRDNDLHKTIAEKRAARENIKK
jgi:hypothetical protein